MSYWRLFYHIVWTTRNREPLLPEAQATEMYRVIVPKATQMGATVHAVGGIEDHVHLAASVPPRLALSEFVGQSKGSRSHFANHQLALTGGFAWQAEYGVVSFDHKQLPRVVEYVTNQRQHHAVGKAITILERSVGEGEVQA